MPDTYVLIFLCALITYGVRSGGHILMAYFGAVNHRIEAGLNAVPIAVLSALVAPTIVAGHWSDAVAIIVVCLLSLRISILPAIAIGVLLLAILRHMFV
ncbi:AzlD family protein [Cognatishimia activa]|uniref:AzlD family protein n=1 Tax=Cognatishimia activa TaxID=1715691 RepID=UPI00222F9B30|nr:AzlD domain-containing protein [Cognatishimia activa]UZD91510.1 AzlD domain-containing protein [Cognatishimia activa]